MCGIACWAAGASGRADQVDDLARIHVEALGGRARIEALKALRATGSVIAGGKQVRFTMIAARPNSLRLETESGGRTLVQAYDGNETPWQFDTGTWPPRYDAMPDSVGRPFIADAEFDDPLVAGTGRGYTFDYAGETRVDGVTFLRVLVTRDLHEVFSIMIDPETYLMQFRVEERKSPAGLTLKIMTRYSDYRPVDGVLLPHQVVMSVDGKVTQQTRIESMTANPEITPETFTRPLGIPRAK